MKGWACVALCVAGLAAGDAVRAQTTIYRCTDAKGEMTVQNAPCPEGSKQDKREVKDVATQPLPASLKSAPAPVRATSASEAPAATLSSRTKTPPPLHLSAKPETPVVAAPSGPATTIYRCTDAGGEMTVQNAPCPKGSKQDKREVREVTSMPLPGNAAAVRQAPPMAASADAATPSLRADGARSNALAVPPSDEAPQTLQTINGMTLIEDPTLHKDDAAADALAGRNNSTADTADASRVTGNAPPILFQCTTYDSGSYLTEDAEPQSRCAPLKTVGLDGNAFTGSGKACQVIHDVCARVPDQKLCSAWKKRLGETEVAAHYAKPENEARNQAEYQRVLRIVNDAGCVAR
ncbi:DUF4124 domain-containing protein [Pseudoxanthomonas sp.]|uniref:DUF4124 domain-containing protein n=1 Tax=Pseudoxanthomonas sp. TaxID=1871049 RepID=UPI002616C2FF|nr:DUF4124 domain-containing protein [Pseudoxanthomonas sp.]WDS37852.1 MAG: DUF4124 domain-containing protein [Pseudoxanthomonas sp.]